MKKKIIFSVCIILFGINVQAQKGMVSALVNFGTTITLTESSYYKPGLHLGGIFAYGVSKEKSDALTLGAGYHTFKNKLLTNDVVKMMDIKIGYRFFPSEKAHVYLHPNIGTGFFADGSGSNANVAVGVALGYMPNLGNGNLNVFAAYNKMSFNSGVSLLNLGAGYQFNFKGK